MLEQLGAWRGPGFECGNAGGDSNRGPSWSPQNSADCRPAKSRCATRDSPTEPRILKLKRDAPGIPFYFHKPKTSVRGKKSILMRTDSWIRIWHVFLLIFFFFFSTIFVAPGDGPSTILECFRYNLQYSTVLHSSVV